MKTRNFTSLVVATLLVSVVGLAGDRSNVRGISMGRTFLIDSRSVDCLGINPANLGLDDRLPFTLALPSVGFLASSTLLNYDAYNNYFTGVPDPQNPGKRIQKVLTAQDQQDLLNLLPENGTTRAMVEANLFGFSVQMGRLGAIGFDVTEHVGMRLDLPRNYVKMFLLGFDSTGSNYNFDGTSASAWWYREWNVSYANHLKWSLPFVKDLRWGVGFKILRGYGVMVTDHYKANIANNVTAGNQYDLQAGFDFLTKRSGSDVFSSDTANKPKFNFKPFPDPAGKGVGFDFGLNGELLDGIRIGVSLTDVGSISWTQNLIETYGNYNLTVTDPFNLPAQDSLKDGFKGKNRPGQAFSTPLPTKFRMGAAFETKNMPGLRFLPGNFLVEMDYEQGMNNSLGNSTIPRVSLGTEWRIIPILPLRTGLTLGGGDQFRWAFGFGFDVWIMSLDIGTENFGVLFTPKSLNMASVALGLRLRL